MKRSQEELPSIFSVSQQHQQLTHESLCKLDQHSQPFSPISLLAMSSSRASDISDVVPLRPESSRSTIRSRSTSPSRPTDAQYRASNLFRANIAVDVDLPPDIEARIGVILQKATVDDRRLSGTAKKLCDKSKELVRGSAGEAEWMEVIQVALEDLGFSAVKFVRNRGHYSDFHFRVEYC
jgi:hypothetical protein